MCDDDDPFFFHYLSLPENPRDRPSGQPENEQRAFDDVINELIGALAVAAKDRSDPLRPFRILTACHSIAESYTEAGFDIFAEFEHALRHDLHNALRMARRIFLRNGFLLPYPSNQYAAFKQVLTETGWRNSGEAGGDYRMVVEELFDGDDFRPAAKAERARRNHAPR
jgi:hypothetical protein